MVLQNFPKNCMELRQFWSVRWGASSRPANINVEVNNDKNIQIAVSLFNDLHTSVQNKFLTVSEISLLSMFVQIGGGM